MTSAVSPLGMKGAYEYPASHSAPLPGVPLFRRTTCTHFFGREEHVIRLLDKLEASRFVAVVGSSGSEQSSIVSAGLLPTLRLGLLRDVDDWQSLVTRASRDPFLSLAKQILRRHLHLEEHQPFDREQSLKVEGLALELQTCPGGMAEVLQQFDWPPGAHFLLVVDQFEELFSFRFENIGRSAVSREHTERFVQFLLKTAEVPVTPDAAASATLERRVWIVITLRSDFIGQCEIFPALAAAVSNSLFLVPECNRDQISDAIRSPGQGVPSAAYAPFEIDQALLQMILNESEEQTDQFPLMQHALLRTWVKAACRWERTEDRDHGQRVIIPADYVPVSQALDQHAEEAWRQVSQQPPLAALTRALFLSLCDMSQDGVARRRRCTVESVLNQTEASMGDLERVIRIFQEDERHFISPSLTDGPEQHDLLHMDLLDLGHDALLRQWRTYRGWQEEERAVAAELRDLCRRSQLFLEQSGRGLSRSDFVRFSKWGGLQNRSLGPSLCDPGRMAEHPPSSRCFTPQISSRQQPHCLGACHCHVLDGVGGMASPQGQRSRGSRHPAPQPIAVAAKKTV